MTRLLFYSFDYAPVIILWVYNTIQYNIFCNWNGD